MESTWLRVLQTGEEKPREILIVIRFAQAGGAQAPRALAKIVWSYFDTRLPG